MKFAKTSLLMLLSATFLLAGCGGSEPSSSSASSSDPSSSSTSSKADSFIITWANYDGTILETDYNVAPGDTPTFDGATPKKPTDDQYFYTWKGWDKAVAPASKDETYTATFDATDKTNFHFSLKLPVYSMWDAPEGADATYEFDYKDAYFSADNTVRDDNLGLLSLGLAGFNGTKPQIESFLEATQFTDVYHTPTYDTIAYRQIAYTLAKKDIGENDTIVALTIRGFYYEKEMVGNFFLGESGDHDDFTLQMHNVYDGLMNYISEKVPSGRNIKLWTVGYSRAAAVSNLLGKEISKKIADQSITNLSANNLYFYCFETPKGADIEENGVYPFIHNYVNSRDIVTYIAPVGYGFKILGDSIDLYDENVADLLVKFNENLILDEFKPYKVSIDSQTYAIKIEEDPNGEKDLKKFIENTVALALKEKDSYDEVGDDLSTRAKFFKYIEKHLQFGADFVFGLTSVQIMSLAAKVMDMTTVLSLIGHLADEDPAEFVAMVEGIFNECEITYEKEKMDAMLADLKIIAIPIVQDFMMSIFNPNQQTIVNHVVTYISNVKSAIVMHLLETTYVLLANRVKNAAQAE